MPTAVSLLALVVAVAALVVALRSARPAGGRGADGAADDLPSDVLGLRREVAALRSEGADALRHLAVVRYDAFGDVGGGLSWSLALLDDAGSGVVLSSIHGRAEARTYAKSVSAWTCDQPLSPEEQEAVDGARPR